MNDLTNDVDQNNKKDQIKQPDHQTTDSEVDLDSLRKYYLSAIPVLLILLLIQIIFKLDSLKILYTIIGFIWPYTFNTPGFLEKIKVKKNRYSFLTTTFSLFDWIYKVSKIEKRQEKYFLYLRELLPSILFILILSSVIQFKHFYFVFFGNIFYILFYELSNAINNRII